MQNRKILTIVVFLAFLAVILGLGVWLVWGRSGSEPEAIESISDTNTSQETEEEEQKLGETGVLTGKEGAWQAFQNYLTYNKNHNLAGVKSVVYKVAPVCDNSASSTECFARMDAAYYYGSEFKKEDFKNFYEDSKQAILASDLELVNNDISVGQARKIIFFVKEKENFKLLRFYPSKGIFLPKGGQSVEELSIATRNAAVDKDQDGMEDSIEICQGLDRICVETDPKKRDTDGDGWWDGVEAQFEIQ